MFQKNAITTFVCLILIQIFTFAQANGQNEADKEKKEIKWTENEIEFTYKPKDRKNYQNADQLRLTTKGYWVKVSLDSRKINQLKLYLEVVAEFYEKEFSYDGENKVKIKKKPTSITFYVGNKSASNLTFDSPSARSLWFDADDSKVDLFTLIQLPINIRGVTEVLMTTVRLEKFLKIVESKKLKGHIGVFEFNLTPKHRKILKAFSEKIQPSETEKNIQK